MAVTNLLTRADYSIGSWTVVGGGAHWQACNSYDAGSNYAQIDQFNYTNQNLLFFYDTMPLTDGSPCTVLMYYYSGRNTSGVGSKRTRWQLSATPYDSGDTIFQASWTLEQHNPSSSPSMTETNINAMGFGLRSRDGAPSVRYGRCEQIYLNVTYTPPSGLNVVRFGLGLIGSALTAAQWAAAIAYSRAREIGHNRSNIQYNKLDLERLRDDWSFSQRKTVWLST